MNVIKRIQRLIAANVNALLDQAEDPEVMVRQIIREMEESIIELRRETVRAVARHKQLQRQVSATRELVADLEGKARLALARNDEALAREAVARKLHTARAVEVLEQEQAAADQAAAQLKTDLARLEDQVQVARRRRDDLVRRQRAAEAQQRTQAAARRTADALAAASGSLSASSGSLDAYAAEIARDEAEVEAEREMLTEALEKELALQRLAEEDAIDNELRRLRQA